MPRKHPSNLVPRRKWAAFPPKSTTSLTIKPITHVIFTYNTYSKPCVTHEQCEKLLQTMQNIHMEDPDALPDIAYNFIVGGDGRVYEGRGWDALPEISPIFPEHYGESIEFGFIGNYDVDDLPMKNVKIALDVVRYGIYKLKVVSEYYQLLESEPKVIKE